MVKVTENLCWKIIFLVIVCISFQVKADQTEVIHIDRKIIEQNIGETSPPTLPFYPAGVTNIKICNANEVDTLIRSLHTEREFKVNASLLVDGKKIGEKKVTLPPGRTVPVTFKLPFILNSKHEIKVLLSYEKPDNLLEWEKALNFSEREAVTNIDIDTYNKIAFVPFKVKIDGDISEWKGIEPIVFHNKKDVFPVKERDKWKGPDDLSAKIYLGWDDKNMYIAAEVKDDKHFNLQSAKNLWDGDAIQFAFVPFSVKVREMVTNVGVSLSKGRSLAYRWGSGGSSRLIARSVYAVKRDEEKKVTYYEIQMPTTSIRFPAKNGQMFSFNIVVFDDDNGKGHKYWMELTPGLANKVKAEQFKNYILWK
jgi:hypothetical protein